MFDLKLLERVSPRSIGQGRFRFAACRTSRMRVGWRDVFEVLEYRVWVRSIRRALVCGADAGPGEYRRVTAYVIPNEKRSDATR